MPQNHLLIFAKAPRYGAVKSRLATNVGHLKACQIFRNISTRIIKRLCRDTRWKCSLAVTPDKYARVGRFWPDIATRFTQGSGDLGDRMSRPLRELPPGPIVMIGSDIPDITGAHIIDAFRALGTSDFVFGPSRDGGFWLVGIRRRPARIIPFHEVRWSSPTALSDTINNIGPKYRVTFLEELEDIDDAAAWQRWREQKNQSLKRDFTSC